ncbi:hypothetical protein GCK72_018256 [Caenorhabditis remanei]|uniref:Uncharacterized protein n=1 Tax=Caenorhabditis remanei TaxID=31234 RepID=A0A6A5GB30_CAERE|nr:hypothetical protein GCK72_018256 [Caenorhabditis remanei]KAF1751702.1 hypothetical protein GCK72_018256 [Caenorhabditis remanei]
MAKFGDRMKNGIEQSKNPAYQRKLLIRDLHDATKASFNITTHDVLRPTYTIYPNIDTTARNTAEKLAEIVQENETELLENIQLNSLIALVSINVDYSKKIQILNFTIKWLLAHEIDETVLNYLLMGISGNLFTVAQIGRIRLAILLYITSPDLYNFFDIHVRECGNVFIHRKLGIPGDPSDTDLYYDEKTQVMYCNIVNKVTDNYYNQSWPEGNRRKEREGPTARKRRRQLRVEFVPVQDLKNPLFKWDFEDRAVLIDKYDKHSADLNLLSHKDVKESKFALAYKAAKSAISHSSHSPHNNEQGSSLKEEDVLFHTKCSLSAPKDVLDEEKQEDSGARDEEGGRFDKKPK